MTRPIQMVDLHGQYLRIKPEIDKAIQDVLDSTAFINGPPVESFASALSEYIGGDFVIPCANGTDALQIAMMALELQPGDEVIVPVHTYVATAEVIALLRLKPVFVDVLPDVFTIDVDQVESRITKKTRAIVPVNLYGQCAHLEPLQALARKHNLYLIEDNAQALGADYKLSDGAIKKSGTIGTIGTTSFFPSKNLGCFGDGGAVHTKDQELATKIKMIANHGQKVKYHHDVVGINSRLDTLQAAILQVKLRHLAEYTQKRNQAAAYYDFHLSNLVPVHIPIRASYSTHVFHQYTLRVDRRDELKRALEAKGIPTMIYYPVPLHLQPAYLQPEYRGGTFPVSERLSQTVLSLPIHTELTTWQQDQIIEGIMEFYQ